eukprot:CAMPEP_0172946038 /NCGR_PEP_ID=MMETSP1075-20121228/226860_1 /TAXON_ID=2916 /ORGANISM="Ceratium fusus, Strain PA161109" /LENGTH=110 /DNA_ID=CAMNT_0013807489 /DNA_START=943 /DNA_END=1275 /DNA_ORIENTATION=-
MAEVLLEVQCHETSEGDPKLEVYLLPSLHTLRLALARALQRPHGIFQVWVVQGGEASPVHTLRLQQTLMDNRQNLKADILALAVAIKPQHDSMASFRLIPKMRDHPIPAV